MKKTIVKGAILFVFILMIFLLRWGYWIGEGFAFFSSDDSIPYLMSKHIADGENFPLFFYGQFYHGAFASYFYAVVMSVIGFSVKNLVIINILLFSLGCFFLSKIFEDSFRYLFYFIIPFPALLFISTDTSVHFPFIFLISSYLIWTFNKLENNFSLKHLIFASFVGGLFFWIYQGALVILVPFFLFTIVRLIKNSKNFSFETAKTLFFMCFSFLIGVFPLIYSELKNGFVTSKFTFASSGSFPSIKQVYYWLYNFFLIPDYNHYLKKTAELKVNEYLHFAIVLFTFIGFLLFVIFSFKKRKYIGLVFFSITSVILVSFSNFGKMIAEDSGSSVRYEIHSLVLLPLSFIFFVFLLQNLDKFLCTYIFKNKVKIPVFLFIFTIAFFKLNIDINNYSFNGGKDIKELSVELEKRKTPTLYFGDYLKYFRLNSITNEKKLFVPPPFPPADIPFFLHVRYYPYTLRAFNLWQKERFGFIIDSISGKKLKNRIDKIFPDLNYNYVIIKGHTLFEFPPQTPLEILVMNKFSHLYKYASNITDISLEKVIGHGNMIEISFKRGSEVGANRRLRLENKDLVVEFPLHIEAVKFRANTPLKKGRYKIIYKNISLPVEDGRFIELGGESEPEIEFSFYSDPFNLIYFDEKEEKYINVRGLPVSSYFSLKINSEKIREIRIEICNPFNFESDLWQKNFKQEVLTNSNKQRSIILNNGKNLVEFKVERGDSLELEPKYKTFFKLTDSSLTTYFKPVGIFITKILIIYNDGEKKNVTPLLINDYFMERQRVLIRKFR